MGVHRQNFTPQRKGTSQFSRLSPKLLPEFFSVDERSLSDLLAFTADFAQYIDFHRVNDNEEEGRNWEPIFTKDISILLASIISIDVGAIDRGFEYLVQKVQAAYDPDEKLIAFEALLEYIIGRANWFLGWYKRLMDLNGMPGSLENDAEIELWKVIDQKLRDGLININLIVSQAPEVDIILNRQELPFNEYGFDEIPEDTFDLLRGESTMGRLESGLVELRSIYHIVFNCVVYSKSHFRALFERSLEEKHDHHPDVAMMVVFLRLFEYAQKDLNEITLRHLEYYYRHILQQEYRPALSDVVHICFELTIYADSTRVPQGTMLFAGRNEDGIEIRYETTEEVEINKAEVASLKSVFISRVLEGQTYTYRLVTGLYGAPVANSLDGRGASFGANQSDWALFGEEQYKSGRTTMQFANMGFAISSPMLVLKEGRRKVIFDIEFSEAPEAQGTYQKLIEDLSEGNDEDDLHTALFEVFGRGRDFAFNVEISTEVGWINVADVASNTLYMESRPWDWNKFRIGFTIPASVPPIIPIDPSVMMNDGYSTRFPVVKFQLNPQKNPFPYTFLETLRFESIEISVEVDRVKNLALFNDLGQLDPSQPFQALGAIPQIGSYMLVGNSEIFKKDLTYLRFHINWQNLPSKGLRAYYEDYFETEIEIDESKFKVDLTALSGYEFKPDPEDDHINFQLFPQDPTTTHTYLEIPDPRRLQIRPNPDLGEVDQYNNQTPIGFFKLELTEPKLAFGHSLFQERMTEVAMHNSSLDEEEQKRYPNPPFSPIAQSVELSYRAKDKIVFEQYDPMSRNEIYHIHPFGIVPIYTKGNLQSKDAPFIPSYGHDGYLYIGLKDLNPPEEVSLLFQLAAGRTTFTAQLPTITWSFLTNSGWADLRTIDLLSDTTESFTKTGIVRLRIPSTISRNNPELPQGMHWLRVSIIGNTDAVSRALEIRSQAVLAKWYQDPLISVERLKEPLAADTIDQVLDKISEIRAPHQPYPSFNARPEEDQHGFFQRVSERLRHKNRAISHYDFERMILAEYHTIAQVKCLSSITNPDYVLPGDLRIVVIPGRSQSTDALTPKVNHGTLLEIQNYLKDRSSAFVNPRVSNPSYEYVRVNCRVKFANRKNNGESLEKLREDIKRFICPWLGKGRGEIEIGGSIKVENLFRYIRSLPYVDFITKFAVLHFYVENEETGVYSLKSTADPRLSEDERSYIRSNKPWSVLIPDRDHEIEFTDREMHVAPEFNLEPVDFQGRFQISPHLIKILPKKEIPQDNPDIRYDQEDTLRIFVDIPD